MASRLRQSIAPSTPSQSQSAPTPSQRRISSDLSRSEYAPPEFSLTVEAQQALAQLANNSHLLKTLEKNLRDGQTYVMEAASDMHERLYRKKRRRQDQDPDEELDRVFQDAQTNTANLTTRLDDAMRKLVDNQHRVASLKTSLRQAAEHARENASTQASTQQRRRLRRQRTSADDDGEISQEESESEQHDFEPTDPTSATLSGRAPLSVFQDSLETERTRYESHSLTSRYAENPTYRDFRRVMHDAQYPDGDVPMPHADQWFGEDGTIPAPGVTNYRAGADESNDDDDVQISKTKISTKCPLTLLEFRNPVTSTKCPHSFEKEAILGMIKQQRGQPIQCPVGSCREMLQAKDLKADAVLIRKIRRLQLAQQMEQEDGEDELEPRGTQLNSLVIDDLDEDVTLGDDSIAGNEISTKQEISAKKEPRGSNGAPLASAPTSTRPSRGRE